MLLKEYRRQAHLTQEEIARVLGIPKKTYQNYEREVREADSDLLCKLADYYGVTLDQLVGRVAEVPLGKDGPEEVDELVSIFQRLDAPARGVLLDTARSLEARYGG